MLMFVVLWMQIQHQWMREIAMHRKQLLGVVA